MTSDRRYVHPPRPFDVERALGDALSSMAKVGGDFALIGGIALNAHGIERFTKGIDFAVTVAQSGRAEIDLAEQDPQRLRIGGVSVLTPSGVRADLIDHRFAYRALFEELIEAAKREGPIMQVGSQSVPVAPAHYLVALKLAADRAQDLADLGQLLLSDALDYPRARAIVAHHLGPYAALRLDKLARGANREDTPTSGDPTAKRDS